MARPRRIELAGGLYHVTNRGVDRRDIVCDDADRREWFRLFNGVALRYGWRVFAKVLMTNHFHLFVKIPEPNLSAGLQAWESAYARYFNKRRKRDGALFQGRFHPVLVESDGHAWSVSRYVHLNPCRAGLAAAPEAYRWSTYRFFVDPRGAPAWLDWRTVLCELGGSEASARSAYCRYVAAGLADVPPNPLTEAFDGALLGSESFVAAHRHLLEDAEADAARRLRTTTLERAIAIVAETFAVDPSDLRQPGRHDNWPREAAVWLCRQAGRVSLKQIGLAFGNISPATVTDTVRRCEDRQRRVAAYRAQCEALLSRVRDTVE